MQSQYSPKVPKIAVLRLALYAKNLDFLERQGLEIISSLRLAELCGVNPAQIRKDLAYFGQFGVRGRGYYVKSLLQELHTILGINRRWTLGLVGAGNLGRALLHHAQFAREGFVFSVIFDKDPAKVGTQVGGLLIRHINTLGQWIGNEGSFDIAMLATGTQAAQTCTGLLIKYGIRAILNFTPVKLQVPEGVYVEDVDMTLRLNLLCYRVITGSEHSLNG
ncbi:redox-sensing transcriptional repressor Rex [Thermodesulfobacteriota bacterium]